MGICAGCGPRAERISVPSFSPSSAATKALKLFDENGNSTIEGAELTNCPSLLMALPRIDQDGDGKLTHDEISARIGTYNTFGIGLSSLTCVVTLDGQPLSGAQIRFEPEEFMLGSISPAVGDTDGSGRVSPRKEGSEYNALQVGMYRVRVSRKEGDAETLPAQFNTESKWGLEVAPDVPGQERGFTLELKSH